MNSPTWGDDIIDSRDIIAHMAALQGDINDLQEDLDAWQQIDEEGRDNPDWHYGVTLIHERHFTQYAEELAEDIGLYTTGHDWPGRHIDWEAAAEELKVDYTIIEVDGETYYMR